MQLEHSFTVPVGIAQAWEVLLDVETVAPCMPGAILDSVDGDSFTGRVKSSCCARRKALIGSTSWPTPWVV